MRPVAIARLASRMPPALLRKTLDDMLRPHVQFQYNGLDELGPHLSEEMVREVLEALDRIGDQADKVLLPWLYFGAGEVPAALDAVRALRNWHRPPSGAEALSESASRIPTELLGDALKTARETLSGGPLATALEGLAPYLTPDLLPAALNAVMRIWESSRARGFAALAPYLSEPLLQKAVANAGKMKSAFLAVQALLSLVPQLKGDFRAKTIARAESLIRDFEPRATSSKGIRIIVELLGKLADVQPDEQKTRTLARALTMTLAIEEGYSRNESFKELAPHLTLPLLRQASEVAREHLKAAEAALTVFIEWLREGGTPADALARLREAATQDEWKAAMTAVAPFIKDPRPPEVGVAATKVARMGEWAAALCTFATGLAASGSCEEALAIYEDLNSNRLLRSLGIPQIVRNSDLDAMLRKRIIEVIPFLSEPCLQPATELVGKGWNSSEARAQLAIRMAQLGLYEQALEFAFAIEYDLDRTRALVGLVPLLPQTLLMAKRLFNSRPGSSSTAEREIERPVFEIAVLSAARLNAAPFAERHSVERTKALATLAPGLAKLEPKYLYSLWCELLPVLASRRRLDLVEDLRELIPVMEVLGGKAALTETAQALVAVTRCFP
jgi:hypothetical protein